MLKTFIGLKSNLTIFVVRRLYHKALQVGIFKENTIDQRGQLLLAGLPGDVTRVSSLIFL